MTVSCISNAIGARVDMTESPPPLAPKGWYTDPENGAQDRYWDGSAWTTRVEPHARETNEAAGEQFNVEVSSGPSVDPVPEPPRDTVKAGWYNDNIDSDLLRYWDGSAWTSHTAPRFDIRPRPRPVASSASPAGGRGLAVTSLVLGILAYLLLFTWFSLLFSLAALACGVPALVRRSEGKGLAVAGVILGGVGVFVALAVLAGARVPGS